MDQAQEVNTAISPRVKEKTKPEMVDSHSYGDRSKFLGTRNAFPDGGTILGLEVPNRAHLPPSKETPASARLLPQAA